MNHAYPGMSVTATIRTRETAPDFSELQDCVFVNHDAGKYHAETKSEIRIALHKVDPEHVARILEGAGLRISRFFLTPFYDWLEFGAFWNDPPDECVGGLLYPDGTVGTVERGIHFRAIPIDEPLYTSGRPEADTEHRSREKPHVIQAAGTTIVSDGLLGTLRKLGAQGETGTLVYRGSNKSTYDTVQPGFQRFRAQPEYDMPYPANQNFDFLPDAMPEDFGICGMIRTRDQDRWYEIALSLAPLAELRRLRRTVMQTPIFRQGGPTHRWVTDFAAVLDRLSL